MKMDVEDFLAGGGPIGQEQIHSFAHNAAVAQSRRQPLCHTKDVSSHIIVQVG